MVDHLAARRRPALGGTLTMRITSWLQALLAVSPVASSAQAGIGFSIGTRTYRSGPVFAATNPGTFQPMQVTEYFADLHLISIRRTAIGLRVGGFRGDFGPDGRRIFIAQTDAVHGYAGKLTAERPLLSLASGGTMGIAAEAGIESVAFGGEEHFRGVFGGGSMLRLPLTERWDLRLVAMASALSSSPYRDEVLGTGVTNGNHWWTTLRIGVTRRFGRRQ